MKLDAATHEFQEEIHPCYKKNLRYFNKRNHNHVFRLIPMLTSRKQFSKGHKGLYMYSFSSKQKTQQSFSHLQTTTSHCSLQVLDKQDYRFN